jgi:hypothetical protein
MVTHPDSKVTNIVTQFFFLKKKRGVHNVSENGFQETIDTRELNRF